MLLIALSVLTYFAGPSLALPIDFGLTNTGCDLDGYCGPYSRDFYGRGLGRFGPTALPGWGNLLASDSLDLTALSADLLPRYIGDNLPRYVGSYLPFGYPRVQAARENFVRGNAFGTTEVGVRDEVSVRSADIRSRYPRYNCNIYPFSVLSCCRSPYYNSVIPTIDGIGYKRPFPFGLGVGVAPLGQDDLLLRK